MNSPEKGSSKEKRKLIRKQNRCKNILLKHEGLQTVETATKYIFVGNGGLICGVQRETLMELFSAYGVVEDIAMILDKPYSFVVYENEAQSESAMHHLNGHKLNPDSESALHLCYVNDIPRKHVPQNTLPPGVILIPEFVTEEEEQVLLNSMHFSTDEGVMKHRKVRHFGYEFNYSNNNIDKNKPLEDKIPDVFHGHLERLLAVRLILKIPDQLTVNHYMPGQGIPPHIDTHSAFENGIISLSLGSQVIMDFYSPWNEHIPVLLPRRSLLMMKDESRYLWKHGITPRKTDVIPVFEKDSSYFTLGHREPRTSFTFRCIRQGPCNCDFINQCDSQSSKEPAHDVITEEQAKKFENEYVTQVYEHIADHFSETRFKRWPLVAKFIDDISVGSILVDAGCGNGKNMNGNSNCYKVGCDVSQNLAKLCASRKLEVVAGDVLHLPFKNECADVCICIAVIHHMITKARRCKAVDEITRILVPGGRALIYVWALEQETSDGPSNYLNHNKILKKTLRSEENQHILKESDLENCRSSTECSTSSFSKSSTECDLCFNIPVHENRTHFQNQDVLVPWHKKCDSSNSAEKSTETLYHRYYHVFVENELESLISKNNVEIVKSYYDRGNWCVEFRKIVKQNQ